ncbi:aspartate ammonia-lyase [Dermatophilus congolensis]|uniref:aspartate ammonia-lyase n=1 Tax=Dermatophilus congolensis TaxID=1863 RepID=UPI001AAF9B4F|nr:aspartate ammonia-lyase [Dermatophilus congolensis]MBO3142363.1 aspartate ammonia-lyase [Dermatophilus congolensis]MBO3151354.1 aspartate ammonia-lyase [Dermatophilus congolensis]MBO3161642.1 aspartate ammonia-lyase [Dermatophilus congolensis]MBO3162640.1 aspartate ammonia-lyase [Dermatophilus congolensis]MBO3176193.1 aspartate ammonia-lyase [Dermatophilus congolensis]
MSTTRTETDLLGSKDVPANAYYGIHATRAIENFPISGQTINDTPAMIRGMVMVKKAAAMTNKTLGALKPETADAIIWACDQMLDNNRCMDQFPIDVFQGGAGTSLNMNTNEVIANLALEHLGEPKGNYKIVNPNDDVNRSQSTNDAYPCGFRLAVDTMLGELADTLGELNATFANKGDEFTEILKMGRTQLQDAVPMTLGQEFTAFAVTLGEELRHLDNARTLLLEMNLGATAIGTGLNTPPEYANLALVNLARVSGRPCVPAPNLIEATSDCGAYVMAHAALKRLAVKLSKICNDLRLLSSGPRAGLNEINLPEMQAGSSIMPAKVNPVIPEVVNQVCFKVMGNDLTVSLAAEAGQLQLNVMEPVIAQALFESISLLKNACTTLRTKCIQGITANPDICHEYVTNSIGVVTYLNDYIGHTAGDAVGKEAAATGKSVREIVLERELMDADLLDRVLSRENLMRPRDLRELAENGTPSDPQAAR